MVEKNRTVANLLNSPKGSNNERTRLCSLRVEREKLALVAGKRTVANEKREREGKEEKQG